MNDQPITNPIYQKESTLTNFINHPMLMHRLKVALLLLLIFEMLVCFTCSTYGQGLADLAISRSIVSGVAWLIPAVYRMGSLSPNAELGEFTMAFGMMAAFPLFITSFIYCMMYRTNAEMATFMRSQSTGFRIKFALGALMMLSVILTDMGLIHLVGFLSGVGISDPSVGGKMNRLFHSTGLIFGWSSSFYCSITAAFYAMTLAGFIKLLNIWAGEYQSK
jgi:hypothetical protein